MRKHNLRKNELISKDGTEADWDSTVGFLFYFRA